MKHIANKKMIRMQYLMTIKTKILKALYANSEKELENHMYEIAKENQALVKGTATFFFNGRWWPYFKDLDYKNCNRILHPSLFEKVQNLLENRPFQDEIVKIGIETFISNILSISGHQDDLNKLLPDGIKTLLPKIEEEIFNIASPLSEEKVKKFKRNNEENYSYFKRFLITQLLLNKTG